MEEMIKFRVRDPVSGREESLAKKSNLWTILRVKLLSVLAVFLFSTAGAQVTSPESRRADLIHFGDLIDVDVVGSLEFDWRGGVNPEGFLDGMERLEDPIFALCRSESDVAAAIRDKYRKILREPEVVVRIIDRSNRALAFVTGAVKTPHRFQLTRSVHLTELIVLSGGLTDASSGEIIIFRPPNVNCEPGPPASVIQDASLKKAAARFSIRIADLLGGDAASNIRIVSGDIVTVAETSPIFVAGDVLSPRRMNLTPGLSLSRAVVAAGGAAKSYKGQKVRIHRRGAAVPLEYELGPILDKKADDPKLEPYDVIEVDQKGVQPRKVAALGETGPDSSEQLAKLPLKIVD